MQAHRHHLSGLFAAASILALGSCPNVALAADYTWNQATGGSNVWNTTTNWTPTGVPGAADNVDGASAASPQAVRTGTTRSVTNFTYGTGGATNWQIVVDASTTFTISGTLTRNAAGATGTLEFRDNASSTGTQLNVGNINVSGGFIDLGTGSVGGNSNLPLAGVTISGGTTISAGGVRVFTTGDFSLGLVTLTGGSLALANEAQAAAFSVNATTSGITGTGGASITAQSAINNSTLAGNAANLIINTGTGTSYSTDAVIANSGVANSTTSTLSLTKTGAGTQTLTGVSTYTGATSVKAGILQITTGSIANSAVTVGDSANLTTTAVLAGNGTMGAVTLGAATGNTGAYVRPGNGLGTSAGTTMNTGNFAITAGSGAHLDLQVGRTSGGALAAGDVSDRINVSGAVTLSGDLTLSALTATGHPLASGDVIYLISNDGADAISGQFASINGSPNGGAGYGEGSTFSLGGTNLQLTYAANFEGNSFTGGNDLALEVIAVPEGNVCLPLMAFIGAVLVFRLRRAKA